MTEWPAAVIGPDGMPLTEAMLPIGLVRWTKARKARVAIAVRDGLITVDDACTRYNMSVEEIAMWQSALRQPGLRGLTIGGARYRLRRSNQE